MKPTTSLHRACGAVLVTAALVVVGACSPGGGAGQGGAASTTLRMAPLAGGPFTRQLNPFLFASSSASGYASEMMYEPLLMDDVATSVAKPWLAKSYAWSAGGKTLTINLRPGLKWSDGQPLTGEDVAFTFDLVRKNKALNFYDLPLAGATAPTNDKVVVTFDQAAYQYLWWRTLPVPKKQWSAVSDPVKFTNPNPVGSGPYVFRSFTPQVITLQSNPHWWNGRPKVQSLQLLSYDSDSSMAAALEGGQVDWITTGAEQPQTIAKKGSGKIGYWVTNPSPAAIFLFPNDSVYPTNQAPVRLALSKAIDRGQVSKLAFGGHNRPADSPTGLDRKTRAKAIVPEYANLRYGAGDPAAAKQILTAAGYTLGGDGIFTTPQGQPLQLTLTLPSANPYGDWVRAGKLMADQLKAAGIGVQLKVEAQGAWRTDVGIGKYQLSMRAVGGIPPIYDLYNRIFEQDLKPVGKMAKTNYQRYQNPSATGLLRALADSEPGSPAEAAALRPLEKLMVDEAPIIPLFQVDAAGMWRTDRFTGWPSEKDPYAVPIGNHVNAEVLVTSLSPAGK